MKIRYYPFLIKRDGNQCFYCHGPFTEDNPYEYDHLNNDDNDSRPENTVLTHHSCNVKKKYSELWLSKALGKLKMNEASKSVCERIEVDSGTDIELTSSQQINQINTRITKQFLLEYTMNDDILYLKDAVNAIVNLCQENNDTGSQAAIYRIIERLCNPINGKYTICDYNGKNVIRRRLEN